METRTELAILFADIAGSTQLYEQLGDVKAREATSRCLDLISSTIVRFQGDVIKSIGDEVMCTFPNGEQAGKAAVAIQETTCDFHPIPGLNLRVRIGFHLGQVIAETGDVFGDAVNLAARLTSLAKPGQILTSQETLEQMNEELRLSARQLTDTQVKGKSRAVQLIELTWGEVSDLTITGTSFPSLLQTSRCSLKLFFGEEEHIINLQSPTATIGRVEDNTVVVNNPMISRHHARLEHRPGDSFFLIDLSTNGTYVQNEKVGDLFLHRNELLLEGSGLISPGNKPTEDSTTTIRYLIDTEQD
ncbi:MAG: adenylate/guanylate cyclase domain-containing protein [Thermodesulfobacteriota bacterium]